LWEKAKKFADLLDRRYMECANCGERIYYYAYKYEENCPHCGTEIPRETEEQPTTLPTAAEQPTAPSIPTKEVYREREVITREIVKIRCRHCGTLFEEKLDRCPHCGAGA
jgi:rRNA maturation endonuclease Nob1